MKMVPLGEITNSVQRINPASNTDDTFTYIDLSTVDSQSKTIGTACLVAAKDAPSRARQIVHKDDVLVSTVRPNLNAVAIVPEEYSSSIASTGFSVLRTEVERLCPRYLFHWVRSNQFVRQMVSQSTGANYPAVTDRTVRTSRIPLPPLDEQRRIAAILDKADAIRQKRRQAIAHLDTLTQSIFYRMFLAHQEWETCPLGTLADVDSGITKGRKAKDAALSQTPYLAVSNVQDGYLDLTNVKQIDATTAEIKRFKLLPGDLLLTEGGDPDKLGRGCVWNGEIAECIHQNHIFRVRLNQTSPVTSFFFSQYLRTHEAKQYFLNSAKQTTGIASINKSQLSRFPVPLVPEEDQTRFAKYSLAISGRRDTSMISLSTAESLFASLQSRAFRGEL